MTCYVPIIRQGFGTLFMFVSFKLFVLFLQFFLKVVLWTHQIFFDKSETTFSIQRSLKIFFVLQFTL